VTYFYRVRSWDFNGYSAYSGEISPPSATITAPPQQATLSSGTNVPVSVTATDADGTISKVDFYLNNILSATDTNSPYTVNLNLPVGAATLSARVTDNQGNSAFSAPINVTVPPDTDGDGIDDFTEILLGLDPTKKDTDGDGIWDNADAFPLDPTRSAVPAFDPTDHTAPTITLEEPSNATLLP